MTSSKPLPGRSLAELRPDVATQWHPTKNGDVTPHMVTVSSSKKRWWLGDCGHEWDALVTSRTGKNAGCPICAGKRVAVGINDLASQMPELASEWHQTRNGDLTPQMVVTRSDKRVWWLGKCGHEWDVKIIDRVQYKTGCPYCHGNLKILIGVNDLATLQPGLVSEWHPTKNGDLTPNKVREFSLKKIWWLGKCGHEWLSTVAHRSNGRLCPYCSGKKVLPGFNDLATTDPAIACEWHPTKNGALAPQRVSRGSDRVVWWLSHGHEWRMTVSSRTTSKQGCAVCQGLQVQIGVNDLATTHPEVARLWHPTKNDRLTTQMVTAGHGKKVWWLGDCGHTWIATVKHLTAGRGCAVCRGLQIQIGVNDLASQFPNLASQWHPVRNGDLTPMMVTSSSGRKVWWQCEAGHEWRARVNGRQYGAIGCPNCSEFGFSPYKEGWLYFLEHPTWEMQQIGISNVPERRLSQHQQLGWQVVEVRGPMTGDFTRLLEQDALKAIAKRGGKLGTRSSSGGFDGHTESWPTETLKVESLKQLLEWVRSDEEILTSVEFAALWTTPPKEKRVRPPRAECVVNGCGRLVHAFGYCRLHYRRWRATGDPGPLEPTKKRNGTYANSVCLVDGCRGKPVGRDLCSMHYARFMKTGDPGEVSSRVKNMNQQLCTVDGCSRLCTSRLMCDLHYRRWLKNGDPSVTRRGGKPKTSCSVPGCNDASFGHGLCNRHYKRWRKQEK